MAKPKAYLVAHANKTTVIEHPFKLHYPSWSLMRDIAKDKMQLKEEYQILIPLIRSPGLTQCSKGFRLGL